MSFIEVLRNYTIRPKSIEAKICKITRNIQIKHLYKLLIDNSYAHKTVLLGKIHIPTSTRGCSEKHMRNKNKYMIYERM